MREQCFNYIRGSILSSITEWNKTCNYHYNSEGIRYKKIINNAETIYGLDGNKIIYEKGTNNFLYLYEGNEIIGIYDLDAFIRYFFVKDITGNIISIVHNNVEVNRYKYDAYGNCEVYTYNHNGELVIDVDNTSIGNKNPFRYKSYYLDIESGLYYLNSRYYNPKIGRFITIDNINYIDENSIYGYNLYCYCGNNPIMYSDPSGYDWDWGAFWNGLLMVGTAITAITLSVTTFGAGIPLAMSIVAGVTLGAGVLTGINGVATIIEAGTDYNFVRDGLFNEVLGLSDSTYEIYAGITEGVAAVGSMILGFYHTTGQYKAAKASQKYLGKGYTKAGKNRWVSKDGYRQVRWDTTHHMYKGKPSPAHFNWYEFKSPVAQGVRNEIVNDVHIWIEWFNYHN